MATIGSLADRRRREVLHVRDRWIVVAVQKLRRGIEAIGSHNRSRLPVDPNRPEVLGIAQGLAERAAQQEGAIGISLTPS
jgi:hypothetical protein